MLAELRGDYGEAERLYRSSLEIDERLGDLAGMATTYSQLGNLMAVVESPVQAIACHIRALAIRLRLQTPEAVNNLERLSEYRRLLGAESFVQAVQESVGTDDTRQLLDMLDWYDEQQKDQPSTA
ncbi:tetratricopeptide repeat protein [Thermopolyspora sp. NPDC052614]|uniref:tetratricopeptide repeat protein n=1 Tax=Thermopolyspora sp. NPDC052614 TaxID=3155682 RepID=UPI00342A9A25